MPRTASLLAEQPLLADLRRRDLLALAPEVEELDVRVGRWLIRSSDLLARECFLIVDGVLEVRRGQAVLDDISKGGVVGEMSLLDRMPRRADVVAATKCKVLVLTTSAFARLLADQRVGPRIRRTYEARAG